MAVTTGKIQHPAERAIIWANLANLLLCYLRLVLNVENSSIISYFIIHIFF